MSNPFFSIDTLMKGGDKMLHLVKQCAEEIFQDKSGDPVHPQVEPGFLRSQFPQNPPEEGKQIEHVIQLSKKVIFPGCMKWQSPKFFGYYPSSVNVTSLLGQMFHTVNQSPMFNYSVAPSWTQLENIVVDWSAKAVGLPQKFLLKNQGGGIINNSATESMFNSVNIAKYAKRKELNIQLSDPRIVNLVGYFGEGSHISSQRALLIKDIPHRRSVPYKYNKALLNYELDVEMFEQILQKDLANGLIPFYFSFSFGNTFCAAVDASEEAFKICKKHRIWINADAAWLGTTWISHKYRPDPKLLQYIDSFAINFTKLLLNGTGGALFFVKDKQLVAESFGASALSFHFYKNKYTGQNDVVDYKDWIVGLARRNNGLKMFYFYDHFGLKKIRQAVESQQEKLNYLIQLIQGRHDLFEIHTKQFGVVTFVVLNKNGEVSHQLTNQTNHKIENAKEGFSSPGMFRGVPYLRIVVGNLHTSKDHLKNYFNAIVRAVEQLKNERQNQ